MPACGEGGVPMRSLDPRGRGVEKHLEGVGGLLEICKS